VLSAGTGAAAGLAVLALLASAFALDASSLALLASDLASANFFSYSARSSDSTDLRTEASSTAGAAAAALVEPEPSSICF